MLASVRSGVVKTFRYVTSPMADDEQLVPVFIPALVAILLNKERANGSPLTEDEVLAIRDSSVCMMMPVAKVGAMSESRGYDDLNPENVWAEWQAIRNELHSVE